MTLREKRLAAAVAIAGALWLGSRGLQRYRSAVQANDAVARQASEALDEAEFALARGAKARQQLTQWRLRSLPTDRAIAKSLYQDWVRAQLIAAGLTVEQLADKTLARRQEHYEELSLEARASGTIEQLANFLYAFYAAPHLHRISGATLTPSDGGAKLSAILNIDALILAGCPRVDKLAEGHEQPLPQSQEEYRTSLVSRNIFAGHAPASTGPDADLAQAKLTAMASDLDDWIMTITMENSKKTLRFRRGDAISIGKFTGTVVELDGRRAVIETPEGRVEVRLGQNLGQATKVEPPAVEPAESSEAGDDSESANDAESPGAGAEETGPAGESQPASDRDDAASADAAS